MTPAWPWVLALTIALGALIVSQVQLREAHAETRRLRALLCHGGARLRSGRG